ncbi:Uncharacterised protein [Streptococcus pneumoniae]|nr:hypothetical protein FIU67_02970 [Streptococcus pneumoniae]CJD81436.1 Uncharacterised protein [Streptococcus pneumoniae]
MGRVDRASVERVDRPDLVLSIDFRFFVNYSWFVKKLIFGEEDCHLLHFYVQSYSGLMLGKYTVTAKTFLEAALISLIYLCKFYVILL